MILSLSRSSIGRITEVQTFKSNFPSFRLRGIHSNSLLNVRHNFLPSVSALGIPKLGSTTNLSALHSGLIPIRTFSRAQINPEDFFKNFRNDRNLRLVGVVAGTGLLLYLAGGIITTFLKYLFYGAALAIGIRYATRLTRRYRLKNIWKESEQVIEQNRANIEKELGSPFEIPSLSQTVFYRMRNYTNAKGHTLQVPNGYRWYVDLKTNDGRSQARLFSEAEQEASTGSFLLSRVYLDLQRQPAVFPHRIMIYKFGKHAYQDRMVEQQGNDETQRAYTKEDLADVPDAEIVSEPPKGQRK
eukprot:TRINITY_DN8767_c0_g1_i1.p1 TRINITY_DN8767_c0_g1~~TRINITY_DN8767_c0_g1_i1.p1  ORF type:complete len:300 (-),score=64.52 TRINITY_DN8767_c0_g1_i1:54-953(-)